MVMLHSTQDGGHAVEDAVGHSMSPVERPTWEAAPVDSSARRNVTSCGSCWGFSLYPWMCESHFSFLAVAARKLTATVSAALVPVGARGPHCCDIALPWSWFSVLNVFLCSRLIQFIAFYFRVQNLVTFLRSIVQWGREIHERKKFMRLWDTFPLKWECSFLGLIPGGGMNREEPCQPGVP